MEILRWEIIAPVIGVVGICQAIKKSRLRKLPTSLTSLLLSFAAGYLSAHIPGPFCWEGALYTAFLVYGAATLSYEMVLKKFDYPSGHNGGHTAEAPAGNSSQAEKGEHND